MGRYGEILALRVLDPETNRKVLRRQRRPAAQQLLVQLPRRVASSEHDRVGKDSLSTRQHHA